MDRLLLPFLWGCVKAIVILTMTVQVTSFASNGTPATASRLLALRALVSGAQTQTSVSGLAVEEAVVVVGVVAAAQPLEGLSCVCTGREVRCTTLVDSLVSVEGRSFLILESWTVVNRLHVAGRSDREEMVLEVPGVGLQLGRPNDYCQLRYGQSYKDSICKLRQRVYDEAQRI
jgi:hypothetical protein